MRIVRGLTLVLLLGSGVGASAQAPDPLREIGGRIWLDRGDEPLLQRGDRVRIYYRTEADAFVAIFHVDTDGVVTLLYPRAPDEISFARGGRDYRLLFRQASYWYVDEYPGKGYFFLVASRRPLVLDAFGYVWAERRWDLSRVGRTVYRDPFLAMDDYVALLIPDWESTPYGLDYVSYDVGEVHEYPRFLCYDCHGYRSYAVWNPYTYACASFRVVVWDDPWFHPAFRYAPTRIAFAPPRRGVPRFEFKERGAGEPWTPLARSREALPRRPVGYLEPGAARTGSGGGASGAALPAPARQTPPARVAFPPSAPAPRTEPQQGARSPSAGERPVLQRRPPAAGSASGRPQSEPREPAVRRPPSGAARADTPPRAGAASPPPRSGAPATTPPPRRKPPGGGF